MSVKLEISFPSEEYEFRVPLVGTPVKAGFPSPADDFLEDLISLDKELVKNKASTFYARVLGNSMEGEFSEGDILVVDKSLPLRNNCTAVCYVDGEFTVKKVRRNGGALVLEAANPSYEPIIITEDNQFLIWGIVTYIIKRTW